MKIKFILIIVGLFCSNVLDAQHHTEFDTTIINSYGEYCEQMVLIASSFSASDHEKLQKLRDSIYVERDSLMNFDIDFVEGKFVMASTLEKEVHFMEKFRSFQDYKIYINKRAYPIGFNQEITISQTKYPTKIKLIGERQKDYISIKYDIELDEGPYKKLKDGSIEIYPGTKKLIISNLEIRIHDEQCYNRVTFPEIVVVII